MVWRQRVSSYLLRRLAQSQGFLDPMVLFSRLQQFSKPSEVWVPTELLRLGFILQARGAINSQAIQNNLDWVWPFWINRQFDPKDTAFIPRAFSISNINLTHRNWTALGIPDFPEYPLVDGRGLLTPFWDSWSVDCWIMSADHGSLFPSHEKVVEQRIHDGMDIRITTISGNKHFSLNVESWVELIEGIPVCQTEVVAKGVDHSVLLVCIRPYNPEGISFINEVSALTDRIGWKINNEKNVYLDQQPNRTVYSNYNLGDISHEINLDRASKSSEVDMKCPVGMASVAAIYDLTSNEYKRVRLSIPLSQEPIPALIGWKEHLDGACQLQIPDRLFKSLYDIALRTLILHSPGDVYPGPFTYKRFWFRDSAFILNAMMVSGLSINVEKILDRFPSRQTADGYFLSQEGEWDSNGEALWIMARYLKLNNLKVKTAWVKSITKGAAWIEKKRTPLKDHLPHRGLMPSGFSAEHLGPNDYYYWDDFWSVAGLQAAAQMIQDNDQLLATRYELHANDLSACIDESLKTVKLRLNTLAVPASVYRRMDGGAIGSLVVSYPLQLWEAHDPRMKATVEYILKSCFLDGAFYHEISHSGINVYLSLEVAQVLLRMGDSRYLDIVKTVADLATSTGQWPEAIHPQTKGGCMGDGQHVWAAAEWVLMMRSMFILEEEVKKTIVLCAGISEEWLKTKEKMYYGITQTVFGSIAVTIQQQENIHVSWKAKWHGEAPRIEVRLPGYACQVANGNEYAVEIKRGY